MKIDYDVIKGFSTTFKRPLALAVESSSDCNATCVMCKRDKLHREKKNMDFDLFKKVILDAKERHIAIFQLSFYGESLLDPLLLKKIEFIFEMIPNAWVQIVTNGSLLTNELSHKLLETGISEIRISVEGNDEYEFEKIRKGISYKELLDNITNLKKLRDGIDSCSTQIVITGLNLEKFPLDKSRYKDFWGQFADKVYIRDEHILDFQKKESLLRKILPCHQLFTILPIQADGQSSICIYDWYGKTVYGNLNKNTISDVWYAPKLSYYKLLHLIGLKKSIKFCRNCSFRPNYRKIFKE